MMLIIGNEMIQLQWWVYGQYLFYSDKATTCSEDDSSLMWLMSVFLLMGTLKLVLFGVVIVVILVILILKRIKKRTRLSQSQGVIRSLVSFKYHALMESQSETDVECTICFSEYQNDDLVAKLKCNEKHIFHKECLTQWIATGKNSCPICRAAIDSSVPI